MSYRKLASFFTRREFINRMTALTSAAWGVWHSRAFGAAENPKPPKTAGAIARGLGAKQQEIVNVRDFGAVGDGATDDTAAIQAAFTAAQNTGRALYVQAGTYRITNTINVSGSGLVMTVFGEGNSSVFQDNVTGGSCFNITTPFLSCLWSRLSINVNVNKPTFHSIYVTGALYSYYERVTFEGAGFIMRTHIRFDSSQEVTFVACNWRNINGVGIDSRNDASNGGNFTFIGGTFYSSRCGAVISGELTNNNNCFFGTKFVLAGDTDHKQISISGGTAGSTSVTLGSGFTIPANSMMFLGNCTDAEVVLISSYNSGTGVATLATPLRFTYTTAVEVIVGDLGVVSMNLSPNLVCNGCHFETCSSVICSSPTFSFSSCMFSFAQTNRLSSNDTHSVYVLGAKTCGGSFLANYGAGNRADHKLFRFINATGSGNVFGNINVGPSVWGSDGSVSTLIDPVTADANVSYFLPGAIREWEGANNRMGQATLSSGTVTVANTSVTANTRIFVAHATLGGTPGHLTTTLIAATSFTINSSSGGDTSVVNWMLVEPA